MHLTRLLPLLLCLVPGTATAESSETPKQPPLRVLEAGEMERYLTTLSALVEAGVDAERELGTGSDTVAAARYSESTRGTLVSNGFDEQTFSTTHWNVMMAYTALELEGHEAEMEKAQREQAAALEAMRGQMPPEQYRALVKSMGEMSTMTDATRDVPKENIALVRSHKARLDSILNRAR